MNLLAHIIHSLFPLIALILLIFGIKRNAIYYIISSLWLSIISLIIHFQFSGGEILGNYFNYANSTIYTLNLLVLFISVVRVIKNLNLYTSIYRYISSLFIASIATGMLIVLSNLWINAYFIEQKMEGTPIMQVALFEKPDYCSYRYIFYKVSANGEVAYLCPDHYGLLPSIGHLSVSPDFIASQLSLSNAKKLH